MEPTTLLKRWQFRVDRMQNAHFMTARAFDGRHWWLGVPAITLSTIVGTSVFASLSSKAGARTDVTIGVGLLSVMAAVLVALQTFLRDSELAEKHRVAGARFANIKHKVELLLTFPPGSPQDYRNEIAAIEELWSKVREESPNLPARLWRRIEASFEPEEFDEPSPQTREP